MSTLLPLLGIVALVVAVLAFAGTAVFIGGCLLVARITDSRKGGSDAGRGYRDSPRGYQDSPRGGYRENPRGYGDRSRASAPARRGGW